MGHRPRPALVLAVVSLSALGVPLVAGMGLGFLSADEARQLAHAWQPARGRSEDVWRRSLSQVGLLLHTFFEASSVMCMQSRMALQVSGHLPRPRHLAPTCLATCEGMSWVLLSWLFYPNKAAGQVLPAAPTSSPAAAGPYLASPLSAPAAAPADNSGGYDPLTSVTVPQPVAFFPLAGKAPALLLHPLATLAHI